MNPIRYIIRRWVKWRVQRTVRKYHQKILDDIAAGRPLHDSVERWYPRFKAECDRIRGAKHGIR